MYAIVETGGKQVKVEVGEAIYVEKVEVAEGESYTFDKVLLVAGDETKVGAPYVKGATVVAKCEKQGRGKKIQSTSIVLRSILHLRRVIVSHILSLLLKLSMLNYDYLLY